MCVSVLKQSTLHHLENRNVNPMKTGTTIINFVHDASIMIHLMCFYDVLPQGGGVFHINMIKRI